MAASCERLPRATADQEMASEGLAISVRSVCKKYGRGKKTKEVLKGLNMEVPYTEHYVSCYELLRIYL